ncbi:50S ribosomal subunit L30 [Lineolata rhizophorae]|uniref:Large ribosomal subunit protein mL46 n=1 Tax=Lineolata rhizophorae TaxID=578093 RepID=A0A6A6NYB0_9PEZI|nr:50S ribosomal subunit L30 [Lineolata rhizophorae]
MNSGPRSARRLASQAGYWPVKETRCRSCHEPTFSILRHAYSAAAASTPTAAEPQAPPSPTSTTDPTAPVTQRPLPKEYAVRAGVVLSRAPLITRDLHDFEKAFFLYQRRLNERLAMPFTTNFYFKRGTPAHLDWKRKARERLTPAHDVGRYTPYGEEGWNDEVLVGAKESEPDAQVEALVREAEDTKLDGEGEGQEAKKKVVVERPQPRVTEADRQGNTRSLNRQLQRTLYLMVKNEEGEWKFPERRMFRAESLREAAEHILGEAAGIDMNTWFLGNHPIGHYERKYKESFYNAHRQSEELGEKTFYMKTRIMAGQANLQGNKLGLSDFQWLSKDEIEQTVPRWYWKAVRNMLPDR